ncbi:MAG: cupin domain-containing protein [Ancrocorticia sp.]|uniref:cupin domain-containing protein n=1 Tax=Ancrocorticia sp. TaxID=2593684 RepID=UPI003F933473
MSTQDFDSIFPRGEKNPYGQNFIGQSYLTMLTTEGVPVGNVTFEPGCRNNWHIHHATAGGGQILLCTAGSGWYQAEGEDPVSLEPGSVASIPANVKHWHGAKADSWFAHLAIEVPGDNTSNEWLEPVTDEEYAHLK